MSHTDPGSWPCGAGRDGRTVHDAEHADTCAHCRSELARLAEVVQLARHEGPQERLETPPPQVWDRIAAAVGADLNGNGAVTGAADGSAAPAGNGSAKAAPASELPSRRGCERSGRLAGRLAASGPGAAPGRAGRADGWSPAGRAGGRADHRDRRHGRHRPAHQGACHPRRGPDRVEPTAGVPAVAGGGRYRRDAGHREPAGNGRHLARALSGPVSTRFGCWRGTGSA